MDATADKKALRRHLSDQRRAIPVDDQRALAVRLCQRLLALPELQNAQVVAAYRLLPGEPDTGPALAALLERTATVLLPRRQPDNSLRWWQLTSPDAAHREPTPEDLDEGDRLFEHVDVVICPGVAGDSRGHRLGRGGGSYDRVLAELPESIPRLLLLYDEEVVDTLPVEPHDQLVHVVVTPTRTIRTGPSSRDAVSGHLEPSAPPPPG